jgi:hypothetical protein
VNATGITPNAEFDAGEVVLEATARTEIISWRRSDGIIVYSTNLYLETNQSVLEPDTAYIVTVRRIKYTDQEEA